MIFATSIRENALQGQRCHAVANGFQLRIFVKLSMETKLGSLRKPLFEEHVDEGLGQSRFKALQAVVKVQQLFAQRPSLCHGQQRRSTNCQQRRSGALCTGQNLCQNCQHERQHIMNLAVAVTNKNPESESKSFQIHVNFLLVSELRTVLNLLLLQILIGHCHCQIHDVLHQTTDNTPPAAHHEFGSGSDQ